MPVLRLAEMTWEEVRDLNRERTVAILPTGATEAHGPHLPLSTDVLIAAAMAEAGAERLVRRGLDALILPGLAYTHAGFAAGFPGTISVRAETVAALVVDVATSLHRHGIATLALANAHLDPDHLAALRAAGEAVRDRGLMTIVFPDLTKRPWGGRLGEEFRSGAAHAGQYEGSILMASVPELVREDIQQELEPNPASLSAAIGEGKRTFQEAGGVRAYFGYPAQATAAEGDATISILGEILEEAVLEAIGWSEEADA
jgi:creatinine amidohydrolase